MVFAQMPPFCHPFPPLPKPDPNGAPCVIRGGSSPLPLDDVATLPKRFFVWPTPFSSAFRSFPSGGGRSPSDLTVVDAMSGDAAVPLQTQFNPLSSIKAAHESVAWHLFHVSVLRRQFTLAGRYTADSDITVLAARVSDLSSAVRTGFVPGVSEHTYTGRCRWGRRDEGPCTT